MLPSHFEISSDVIRTSSSYSYCYYQIYNESTLIYEIGALREKGSLSIREHYNTLIADENWSVFPLNSQVHFTYEYNNGVHTATVGNTTITATDSSSIDRFHSIYTPKYNVINLKIKAL